MKNEDAAKILGLDENITPETVKIAFRRAANKYHPDKGGSDEMMKAVNQAYETLKDFSGNLESGDLNYPDELNDAINAILNLADIEIEICGAWVWVTGETKQHSKELGKNGAGFFYASKKKAWYYRPSDWVSKARGSFSMDDIRSTHGSQSVKGSKQKTIAA
jgi:curved DNA-binding protein CbpA